MLPMLICREIQHLTILFDTGLTLFSTCWARYHPQGERKRRRRRRDRLSAAATRTLERVDHSRISRPQACTFVASLRV